MYSPSKYSRVSSNVSLASQNSRQTVVGGKGKRVQVWARIRPTSRFAQDNLELLPDGRVSNYKVLQQSCLLYFVLQNLNVQAFTCIFFVLSSF